MALRNQDPGSSWRQLTVVTAALAGLLGLAALVGWLVRSERLMAFEAGRIPMAPSTAVLFVLFGALVLVARSRRGIARPVLLGLAAAGTAAAGALLLLSLAGVTPAVEHLGMEITGEVAGAPVGHMSPLTAFGFLLTGGAFVLTVLPPEHRRPRLAFALALLLEVGAVGLVLAYLLSRPILYQTGVSPPALNTSLGFALIGGAILGSSAHGVWPEWVGDGLRPRPVYGLLGILAAATLVVAVPAGLLYRDYEENFEAEVEEQLLAVADLKVGQIEAWRTERLSDAATFRDNPVFADLIRRAMDEGGEEARSQVESWLEPFRRAYQYQRAAVVDSAGRTRISVPSSGPAAADASHPAAAAAEVLRSGTARIEGFHRDSREGPVHLTVVTPVYDADSVLAGGVVLRADPGVVLYPLLMQWPTPSRTAETVLIRRDGDDVLFLNELRFREGGAMNLRRPLSDRDLPAARAVLGDTGIVEGVDYRGERVVSALRPVPNSDWKLVAKVDVAEAYGPLRQGLWVTIALVGFLLVGGVAALGFVWQRREKLHYRNLARTEHRYRNLVNSIRDAIVVANTDREIIGCNPAFEDLFGYDEEEILGEQTIELYHNPEDFEAMGEELREHIGDPSFVQTIRFQKRSGEIFLGEANAFYLTGSDGEVAGFIGLIRDVTRREELQAQLAQAQKLESVGRLAGGIAHDFNNLLTVVRAQADLVLMDLEPASELAEEIELIRNTADRAAELTRQLLAFSRDQVLRPRVVDLNGIVADMDPLLQRVLGEDVRIETDLAEELPSVHVDPAQMEHVLMNLAVNARDAMPQGGTLRINTFVEEFEATDSDEYPGLEPGSVVHLVVSDEGVGMDAETRAQIFDPFFTTKETRGGTGLGLATVYGIVQQSDGHIQVESEPAEGTHFTIRLPAVEGEPERVVRAESGDVPAAAASGRVLVVEDDENVRAVARKILDRAGFDVHVASAAETALEMLAEAGQEIDLVLTDLILPGMKGRELVDLLLERYPDVGIVVMSGYAEDSPGSREDLPPEVAFIEKPFTPEALLDAVRWELGRG